MRKVYAYLQNLITNAKQMYQKGTINDKFFFLIHLLWCK